MNVPDHETNTVSLINDREMQYIPYTLEKAFQMRRVHMRIKQKNRSKHGELGDIKYGGIAMAAALIASINHKKGEHYCEKFGTLWR